MALAGLGAKNFSWYCLTGLASKILRGSNNCARRLSMRPWSQPLVIFGVALAEPGCLEAQDLVPLADQALYRPNALSRHRMASAVQELAGG
jgi:hypothetical protein